MEGGAVEYTLNSDPEKGSETEGTKEEMGQRHDRRWRRIRPKE
jgi:hypothetical protein